VELLPSRFEGLDSWINEAAARVGDLGALLGKFPYWRELLDSVVIVLLVTWIGTWVSERIRTNRLRRTIRESVANELYLNMLILDQYDDMFRLLEQGHDHELPRHKPLRNAMSRALDPAAISLLTDTEQVRLNILDVHLTRIADELTLISEKVNEVRTLPEPERLVTMMPLGAELLDSEPLVRLGANIVGTLTQLIPEQGGFVLSPVIDMAQRLQPIVDGRPISQAVWRSSDLRRWPIEADGVVVVWRNDEPSVVASDLELIELNPGGEDDLRIADRENRNWFVRLVLFPRRRWLARLGIRSSSKDLAKIRSGES
jgi:hypothetical protein